MKLCNSRLYSRWFISFSQEYVISGIYDNLHTYFLTSNLDELSLDRFNDSDTEYPEFTINNLSMLQNQVFTH